MDFNESIKLLAKSCTAGLDEKSRKREKKNKYSIPKCMKNIDEIVLNIDNRACIRVAIASRKIMEGKSYSHV